MQWLRNLPISRKFTYAFGIVCGLCILLGVFTFMTFRGIAAQNKTLSGNHFSQLDSDWGGTPTASILNGARISSCCSAKRRHVRPTTAQLRKGHRRLPGFCERSIP